MSVATRRIARLSIVAIGLGFGLEWSGVPAASQAVPNTRIGPPAVGWTYSGGDGSAMETAIIVQGARNEAAIVHAEDRWLQLYRPGWGVMERTAFNDGCKTFDRIRLMGPGGMSTDIYFDRGGCYWRLDPVPE
jgi:hypothetical protein